MFCLEELLHQSFVVLGSSLYESLVHHLRLFLLFCRNILDGRRATVGSPCKFLHQYYIDERVKVGTCLYRVLYWHALSAVDCLEFFQNGIVVAFFVIELVDEENGRFRQFFCVSEVILSSDFGTEASVYEHHHRVGNIHCCEGCADEVVRTGTVYDIQFLALPLNVEDGGENRVSVFLLNREIVRNGVLLSYATAALNLSAFKQEGFCKGSLTRAVITKQRNVLDFF